MKLVIALTIVGAPALCVACPACARDSTPHLALLLGAMIAAPYAVVAVVLHAIRGGPS